MRNGYICRKISTDKNFAVRAVTYVLVYDRYIRKTITVTNVISRDTHCKYSCPLLVVLAIIGSFVRMWSFCPFVVFLSETDPFVRSLFASCSHHVRYSFASKRRASEEEANKDITRQ